MLIKTYTFKLDPSISHLNSLRFFQRLVSEVSQNLLNSLWTSKWLEKLASSTLKAYKIIDESQVTFSSNGIPIYFPSRIRRGIAERVGQIIRSQYKRKACFDDCVKVVTIIGFSGNLSSLVRIVASTIKIIFSRHYPYTLLRQTLRFLRRLYLKNGLDIWTIQYTDIIRPLITNFVFPYSPDDGQAVKYSYLPHQISYQMKLPNIPLPKYKKDWKWFSGIISIHHKIQQKLKRVLEERPLRPILRKKRLKGGLDIFVFQFAWKFTSSEQQILTQIERDQRALSIDLGLVNLATSVVCEAGYQISTPSFIKLTKKRYQKIKQLYQHISGIQQKISANPPTWKGLNRCLEEKTRLYAKLNRYQEELAHSISNSLLILALRAKCTFLVLENLKGFSPPKGGKSLSRRLNNWLRGRILEILTYKCSQNNLTILLVNPWGTSSFCPRCGKKGKKVRSPNDLRETSIGRIFFCLSCGFNADRDYIAALNIYRVSQISQKNIQKKNQTLRTAIPILYQRIGTPLDRPSGNLVISPSSPGMVITEGCLV